MRQIVMFHDELLLTDVASKTALFLVCLLVFEQIVVPGEAFIANRASEVLLSTV